ncbi:MAG: polysaccharide deacetylase family protein [Rhodoferax sp.]|nr:polysaccharide deacetylase family protein [Rhodoferax sp.]
MYHQIEGAPPKGAAFRSLYVSPKSFARQMALLSLFGYQGLSMSALMPYLKGQQTGKVVGITFDDGYLNNLTNALPVLNRYDFSSTCYVVSQQLGKTNEWDRDAGIAQTSLMNASQLRQWLAGGQEVGAHTRHHARLTQTDAATCTAEISLCKSELEDITGAPVQQFCYPYGEYTADHVAMARAAAFESATTTQRSRCQAGDDMMQLPRVPVVRSTTLPMLWLKVATGYEDRRRE